MKNGKERTVLETENVEKSKLLKEKEAEWLREKKELEKQIKCWQVRLFFIKSHDNIIEIVIIFLN